MEPSEVIVKHYEAKLAEFGPDDCRGVDWPNERDAATRYRVMQSVILSPMASILDYGCGTAGFLDWVKLEGYGSMPRYFGYDQSEVMVAAARIKYPLMSFSANLSVAPVSDYVILNGVFTVKTKELSFKQAYWNMTDTLLKAWDKCKVGMAFNVMSKNVDWERDDLLHVPIDMLTEWICRNLSRDFIIRHDYGLYEYTVYVYRREDGKK